MAAIRQRIATGSSAKQKNGRLVMDKAATLLDRWADQAATK